MSISLQPIITGMNGGPEAIMQNFNNVKNEMERMNGSVTVIPSEQFTPINGFSIDRKSCRGFVYKFDSFAIIVLGTYVGNVTLKGWTYKEAVTIPKSYLNGFSKFQTFNDNRRTTDDSWQYDIDFKIDKGVMTVYTRGNEYNNKGLDVAISGILYN
ncbi:hypothetical protein E5340_06775 [Ligilactobacillus murinus]|uniref:Uncharacterized protein n=1 Tax=Ligilactobacillus murinus TaxID=1622 RepID=A0A4V3RPA5_9LACO|nr:hypothetical protein [Ligilactobacillus murinus]TGY54880.1 hypothetical protein E5340_06775 [Ligilactobacillus murinus]